MIMRVQNIFFSFCLLFISCENENNSTPIAGDTPIPRVMISIIDKQGNDLLNPDNPNGYKHENIELYADSLTATKRCENLELTFVPHNNNPTRWFMHVRIFSDFKKVRPEFNDTLYCSTSYLKLNDTTIDVIYSEYVVCGHVKGLVTALYNGQNLNEMGGTVVK